MCEVNEENYLAQTVVRGYEVELCCGEGGAGCVGRLRCGCGSGLLDVKERRSWKSMKLVISPARRWGDIGLFNLVFLGLESYVSEWVYVCRGPVSLCGGALLLCSTRSF